MPSSSSSSSSIDHSQISRRLKSSSSSGSEEREGKAHSEGSSGCSLCNMKPQQDPKKVSNGSMEKKKKKVVRYRECRKNHAANIGGHAVDGCREFMPSGEEGTSAALKCAACNCHRSFHKREVESTDGVYDCLFDSTSRR